jgi:starch synthase
VVVEGETGLLVHYDESDTTAFENDFAAAVNQVLGDRQRATTMGLAGRQRAIDEFGWDVAARRTMAIYESLL